nr:hypothetical protein [uncultured Carboxylicivirga sp.]
MALLTNIDSYLISNREFSEIIKQFNSKPELSKIDGKENTYKIPIQINMKGILQLETVIKVEQDVHNQPVVKAYADLGKPLSILTITLIAAYIILYFIYDLTTIVPILVFIPTTTIIGLNIVNQVRKSLRKKMKTLIH